MLSEYNDINYRDPVGLLPWFAYETAVDQSPVTPAAPSLHLGKHVHHSTSSATR